MRPLISVVIPTYYRNELLQDALNSVLSQGYEPLELVVVDDSGEGHAEPVFEDYEEEIDLAIVRETNGGWGAAYGTGINAASGEYVQLLDDDDVLLDGKITKTSEVVLNDPNTGVGYTGVKMGNGRHTPDPEMAGDVLKPALRFETFPCYTSSMLIDRNILLDRLPLPDLPAANDSNLMIELSRRTNFDYVDQILVDKRRQEREMWTGVNKIEGMKRVLEIQSHLYDQHPEIRREVLADIHYQEGYHRLRNKSWSPEAIRCFAQATTNASTTTTKVKYASILFASLFGKPVINTGGRAKGFLHESLSL